MHNLNGKIVEKIIRLMKDLIFFEYNSSICTKQQYLNLLKIRVREYEKKTFKEKINFYS